MFKGRPSTPALLGVIAVCVSCAPTRATEAARPAQPAAQTTDTPAPPEATAPATGTAAPSVDAIMNAVCLEDDIEGTTCRRCVGKLRTGSDSPDQLVYVSSRPSHFDAYYDETALAQFRGCLGVTDSDPTYPRAVTADLVLAALGVKDGEVELIDVMRGVAMDECVFPRDADGVEFIVCASRGYNLGETVSVSVYRHGDFSTWKHLHMTTSDVESCPEISFEAHRLVKMEVMHGNGDALDDIEIVVEEASGRIPEEYTDYCDAIASGHTFEPPKLVEYTYVQVPPQGEYETETEFVLQR